MAPGDVAGEAAEGSFESAALGEPVGRRWVRSGLAVALLAVVLGAVFLVDLRPFSFTTLRDHVASAGPWAPAAYVVLFVLGALAIVPGTAIMVIGALLFPLPWAFALVWSAAVAGATTCFVMARWFGRGFVGRLLGERLGRLDDRVALRGFQWVLLMRLAGLPPFNILNYAAGLTRIRLRDYVAGTALGVLPLVVAVVAVVGRIGRAPSLGEIVTDPVLYAGLGLVVVVVWVAHRMKRRMGGLVRAGEP